MLAGVGNDSSSDNSGVSSRHCVIHSRRNLRKRNWATSTGLVYHTPLLQPTLGPFSFCIWLPNEGSKLDHMREITVRSVVSVSFYCGGLLAIACPAIWSFALSFWTVHFRNLLCVCHCLIYGAVQNKINLESWISSVFFFLPHQYHTLLAVVLGRTLQHVISSD